MENRKAWEGKIHRNTFFQGIETRLNAYGPLYVEKQPKYWLNLAESFIKARNATTGAPMF